MELQQLENIKQECQILSAIDSVLYVALYIHMQLHINIHIYIYITSIIKQYHTFQDKNNIYILLEYISGGELTSLLKNSPGHKLRPNHVKFYVSSLVLALEYMASKDIVHRDIKVITLRHLTFIMYSFD